MATPSAAFVGLLEEHGLLSADQLDEAYRVVSRFPDATALGQELMRRGWLSPYQADHLTKGHAADLVVGPYRVLDRLGVGGMGAVYKARHARMDRLVALKVVHRDKLASASAVERFYREAKTAAQLSHPNIVGAFDVGEANGTHYFAMEYVDGTDLAKLVKQRGWQPIALACECARQAALGLQHAHEKGVVHRDIKPQNLVITRPPNGPPAVKILDFGLARFDSESAHRSNLTQVGKILGTVEYISPEQAENARKADIRSDIYSLGCTLYCLLTGKPPFPGHDLVEKLAARLSSEAPPIRTHRSEIPVALEQVIAKMLARDPVKRYQTPAEVAAALAPFARSRSLLMVTVDAAKPRGESASLADPPARTPAPASRDRQEAVPPPAIPPLPDGRGSEGELAASHSGERAFTHLRPGGKHNTVMIWSILGGGVAAVGLIVGLIIAFTGNNEPTNPGTGPLALNTAPNSTGPAPFPEPEPEPRPKPKPMPEPPEPEPRPKPKPMPEPEPTPKPMPEPEPTPTVADERPIIATHRGPVVAVAHLREFNFAVTAGTDGDVKWWDLNNKRVYHTTRHGMPITCLAVQPGTETVAVAYVGNASEARVLDPVTRRETVLTQTKVYALAFSDDGMKIAYGQDNGLVFVRDGLTKAPVRCTAHDDRVLSVAFSPDGTKLVSSSLDKTIRLWDLVEGKELWRFDGLAPCEQVAFSAGGIHVLASTATSAGKFAFLRAESGKISSTPNGFLGESVRAFSLSADRSRILLLTRDAKMRLRDLESGRSIASFADFQVREYQALALWSDGYRGLYVGENGLRRWVLHGAPVAAAPKPPPDPKPAPPLPALTLDEANAILKDKPNDPAANRVVGRHLCLDKEDFAKGVPMLARADDPKLKDLAQKELGIAAGASSALEAGDAWWDLGDTETGKAKTAAQRRAAHWYKQASDLQPDEKTRVAQRLALLGGTTPPPEPKPPMPMPDKVFAKEVRGLAGHSAPIHALAISTNVKRVISGSGVVRRGMPIDCTSRVWDLDTGATLDKAEGYGVPVHAVGLGLPDGAWTYTAGSSLRYRLRTDPQDFRHRPAGITPVQALAVGGLDERTVYVASGNVVLGVTPLGYRERPEVTFTGHTRPILCLSLSKSGLWVVTGSEDQTTRLWDIDTHREIQRFTGHQGPVRAVAVNPDGSRVITCGQDKTVRLWDADTGKERLRYAGHTDAVTSLALTPNGRYLLTGSLDRTVRIWEVETGQELGIIPEQKAAATAVIATHDGRGAVVGYADGELKHWELSNLEITPWNSPRAPVPPVAVKKLDGNVGAIRAVVFDPDRDQFLSIAGNGAIRAWDANLGKKVRKSVDDDSAVEWTAFSPTARLAFRYEPGSRQLEALHTDGSFFFGRYRFGRLQARLLAVTPDGRRAIMGDQQGTLAVYQSGDAAVVHTLEADSRTLGALATSLDGRWALAGTAKGEFILWDIDTGKEERRWKGTETAVTTLAFSSDGKQALSGSKDGVVRLWEVGTGKLVRSLGQSLNAAIVQVALSSDDRLAIAIARSTARLIEVETGKELHQLRGPAQGFTCAAFAPDGRRAVLGGADGLLYLWTWAAADGSMPPTQTELPTDPPAPIKAKEVRRFEGHTGPIHAIDVGTTGRYLLSASGGPQRRDCTMRLWEIDTGKPLQVISAFAAPVHGAAFVFDHDGNAESASLGLKLWSIQAGREVTRDPPIKAPMLAMAVPGDRQTVYAAYGNSVLIHEVTGGRDLGRLDGHTRPVVAVAVTPVPTRAVTGSEDNTARLWDLKTGKELGRFTGHERTVKCVAITADGGRVIPGGFDGTLRLWNADTGKQLHRFNGHTASVWCCALSADGRLLLSGSLDRTVRLWDVETGTELYRYPEQKAEVYSVAFSHDAKNVIWGCKDGSLQMWELPDLEELRRVTHIPKPLQFNGKDHVELADTKGLLDFNSGTFTVEMWFKWDPSKPVQELVGDWVLPGTNPDLSADKHMGWALMSSSPQDRRRGLELVIAGEKGDLVKLGGRAPRPDSDDWQHVALVKTPNVLQVYWEGQLHISYSCKGEKFLLAPTNLHVGARKHRVSPGHFSGEVRGFRISSVARYGQDFRPAIKLEKDKDTLVLLDFTVGAGTTIPDLCDKGHHGTIVGATWANDSSAAPNPMSPRPAPDPAPRPPATPANPDPPRPPPPLRNPDPMKPIAPGPGWTGVKTLTKHQSEPRAVAFAPDSRFVATGATDGAIRFWDSDDDKEQQIKKIKAHDGTVGWVAFAPDGSRLFSAGDDKTIRTWDAKTSQEIARVGPVEAEIKVLAFAPDGRRAVFTDASGVLTVCDLDGRSEPRRLSADAGTITCLAVSSSGRMALSGSTKGEFILWSLDSGKDTIRWQGPATPARCVAFRPDGRYALAGSDDGKVRTWNIVGSGQPTLFADLQNDAVLYVVPVPGGDMVLAGTLKVASLLDAKGKAKHTLGSEEKARKLHAVSVAANGARAVFVGDEGAVVVWAWDVPKP